MPADDSTDTKGGTGEPAIRAATVDSNGIEKRQYDHIGLKYNSMHELPAVLPEKPSVLAALGDVRGKRCLDLACGTGRYTAFLSQLGACTVHGYDISPAMVEGAQKTFPSDLYPYLHFAVADCSKLELLPTPNEPFDLIFAGWFLNYAGTESDLTSMFRVIEAHMIERGKFVGITTNVDDPCVTKDKKDFYGLDVEVRNKEYRDPETGIKLGIVARIRAHTDTPIEIDCFQFGKEVYERCADKAGLRLTWKEVLVPQDAKVNPKYWIRYLERPTISIIEAVKQ
ncbi:S-adenosyl-L-methionine-dependent methyltransferase [Massarina eburnea CBS 473.64]|uniref:S-adenosyl-L-methionine-dependent methyltransferase n=1 Tax=Massarina eburnea CBS 473.64 TaxID=1395130 RepID=A0A6A6S9G6_9PLEO|nr:S-adenosyl-L-methionine-dependent methyltransferase [Massarina eburnea CBS 473.64]